MEVDATARGAEKMIRIHERQERLDLIPHVAEQVDQALDEQWPQKR